MGHPQQLEAAREALGEPLLNQQRRGPEDHHPQIPTVARVVVPARLHGFAPAGHLLHLVEHQHPAPAPAPAEGERGGVPLLVDPADVGWRRAVGRGVAVREPALDGSPQGDGRLAHLPGARDHLDEPARLAQALNEHVMLCAVHRVGLLRPLSKVDGGGRGRVDLGVEAHEADSEGLRWRTSI